VTSTLPRVAFEYGQAWCAFSTSARAAVAPAGGRGLRAAEDFLDFHEVSFRRRRFHIADD